MDHGIVCKIRTAPKHMPRQFNLNECFFHIFFKSFETDETFHWGQALDVPTGEMVAWLQNPFCSTQELYF